MLLFHYMVKCIFCFVAKTKLEQIAFNQFQPRMLGGMDAGELMMGGLDGVDGLR